jgi:hypothetical protein
MITSRSAHYWLWFLLFGLVSAVVARYSNQLLTSETVVLLVTGFLGLLFGVKTLAARLARPYDLLIGLLFTGVGALGVLDRFGVHLIAASGSAASTALTGSSILGLYLGLPYALIHTLLGLTSLNHGLKAPAGAAPIAVATSAPSAS